MLQCQWKCHSLQETIIEKLGEQNMGVQTKDVVEQTEEEEIEIYNVEEP